MRAVPSWDEYFLQLARVVSSRSKDPNTQVGCVVIDPVTRGIITTGYNGFAAGAPETPELWQRPTKYQHVRHAERNAIEFLPEHDLYRLEGAILYCTHYPCKGCAERIRDRRLAEVIIPADNSQTTGFMQEAEQVRKLFFHAGITFRLVGLK